MSLNLSLLNYSISNR